MSNKDLSASVSRMAAVHAPADVFSALLEGAEPFAERVALLLIKDQTARGWGASNNFPAAERATWRNRTFDLATQWWPALLDQPTGSGMAAPRSQTPDFGVESQETWGIPIRLGDRVVAVLIAQSDRLPIEKHSISVLAVSAQIRLELDLYKRRAEKLEGGSAAQPATSTPESAPSESPEANASAPTYQPQDSHDSSIGTEASSEQTTESESPSRPAVSMSNPGLDDLEPVRRFARLIATDIRLYNEDAVVNGRKEGNLSNLLQEPMRQGKQTFLQRYGDLGDDGLEILNEAFVQVLAGGDAELIHS